MKLNDKDRESLVKDYESGKFSYSSLAAKYGISRTSVGRIVNPSLYEKEKEKNRDRNKGYVNPHYQKPLLIRLYKKDKDIEDHLNNVDNVQAYIKELIRKDINAK